MKIAILSPQSPLQKNSSTVARLEMFDYLPKGWNVDWYYFGEKKEKADISIGEYLPEGHPKNIFAYHRLLREFYETEKETAVPGSKFPSEQEIKSRVLGRLIKETLAEKLASRYDIVISSDDVKTAYEDTILDQASLGTSAGKARAEARAEKTLTDLYGLSSSKFKNKVLRPFLIRKELEKAVRADEEINAEKLKRANEVLGIVIRGMDFEEAVLLYSEDSNAINSGGSKGMIGRGLLPPEVEKVVFALEPGDEGIISDIVISDLGYHILKVTDLKYRDGYVTHVQLYEILIKPISLDDYLEAQKKRVSIITFLD